MPKKKHHRTADSLRQAALAAVDPGQIIRNAFRVDSGILKNANLSIPLARFDHIYILGAGKAVAPMAAELEHLLQGYPVSGYVIVKYGHKQSLQNIEVLEAGHPVPDQAGLVASRRVVEIARQATEKDAVFFLISGGGSALLEMLPQDISLADLEQFNRLLLACGAEIEEINLLRKQISLVKNGGLARMAAPATMFGLILSDIIGDPIAEIASGPTVYLPAADGRAQEIVTKYQLEDKLPVAIAAHIRKTANKSLPPPAIENQIIGNNRLALTALAQKATEMGYKPFILSDSIRGEAREVAKFWAALIAYQGSHIKKEPKPLCLIGGGEPTVTIRGKGKGGRNQEQVLAVLFELGQVDFPFYFCSFGTDGTDGPTDAAGAWIDEHSWPAVQQAELNIKTALDTNDAYPFFEAIRHLLVSGPTGTNVMDIMFCLL